MYYVRVPKRINEIIHFYQRIGLWDVEDGNASKKGLKLFLFLFYTLIVSSILASAFNTDDKAESIFLAGSSILAIVLSIRLFHIILRKCEICRLIHHVGSFMIENQEDFTRVNNKVKILVKFATFLAFAVIVTIVIALGFHAVKGEKTLPCNIIFLVDYRKFKNSEIFYWITIAFYLVVAASTAVVFLFNAIVWYLMLMFSTKYELLGNRVRNMDVTTKTATRKIKALDVEKRKFLQDLITVIKIHRTIREYRKVLDSTEFKIIFL